MAEETTAPAAEVVETGAATETAAATPTTEVAAPTTEVAPVQTETPAPLTFDQQFEQHFGRKPEEAKAVFEKYEALKDYEDPLALQVAKLRKSGKSLQEIASYDALNIEALEPLDAAKKFLQEQHKGVLAAEDIERLAQKRYGLSEFSSEEEKADGAIQMKIDSAEGKRLLAQQKEEMFKDFPKDDPNAAAAEASRREFWGKQDVKFVVKDELKFKGFNGEGTAEQQDVSFEFNPSPKAMAEIAKSAKEIAVSQGLQASEEGMNQATRIAETLYFARHRQEYAQALAEHLSSQWQKKFTAFIHNAQPPKGAPSAVATGNVDEHSQLVNNLISMKRGK